MTQYKTITEVQLWTKIGNRAGKTQIGVIVDVSDFRIIKDNPCYLVTSSNYKDKYIEISGLVLYVPPEPEPLPYNRMKLSADGGVTWHEFEPVK